MLKNPESTYNYTVKSYDADRFGKMSFFSFFNYLQESAHLNAQSNGFGYGFVEQEHAYWVLTRVLVEIDHWPKWNDDIQIKTWPRGSEGLFAVRDFELIKDGKTIGRVSSYWMILDQETHRPKRMDQYEFLKSDFIVDKAIDRKLEKIRIIGDRATRCLRSVRSSDIDVNGHVNNATYVRWILDAYFSKEKAHFMEFEINYLRELRLDDEFSVEESHQDQTAFYALKNNKGQDVCVARILMK